MMTPYIKSAWLTVFLLATVFAAQQAPVAGIDFSGRLTMDGNPAAKYRVEIRNVSTGDTFSGVSDASGSYVIKGVPPGKYQLKVFYRSIEIESIPEIAVAPGRQTRYDIQLKKVLFYIPDEKDLPRPTLKSPPVATETGGVKGEKGERPQWPDEPRSAVVPPPPPPMPVPIVTGSPSPLPQGTPQAIRKSIDELLAGMSLGSIAFNTPESMRLEEIKSIELALSSTKTMEEIKKAIGEPGPVEAAQIRISDYMEATLTGSGFEITAVTPQRQLVSGAEDTIWRWNIRASEPGLQKLNLTINAIIDDRGKERLRSLQTFSRAIQIQVTAADRVKGFVGKYWQWLWATIVFPLGLYLWRRFVSKKKEDNDQP